MPVLEEVPTHTQIKDHLIENGLKQTWLSKVANINRTELSRKLGGTVLFTQPEMSRINKALKKRFKL